MEQVNLENQAEKEIAKIIPLFNYAKVENDTHHTQENINEETNANVITISFKSILITLSFIFLSLSMIYSLLYGSGVTIIFALSSLLATGFTKKRKYSDYIVHGLSVALLPLDLVCSFIAYQFDNQIALIALICITFLCVLPFALNIKYYRSMLIWLILTLPSSYLIHYLNTQIVTPILDNALARYYLPPKPVISLVTLEKNANSLFIQADKDALQTKINLTKKSFAVEDNN